jgi:hypothetical protein
MAPLQWMWEKRNRARALWISAALTVLIALVDWRIEPYVSLGFLYLFPIMLAAGFLPRWAIALSGATCAVLSQTFSGLSPSFVRSSFETLALAGCGLHASCWPSLRPTISRGKITKESLLMRNPVRIV